MLGVWKAGGACVPLDPASPPERLAALLRGRRARGGDPPRRAAVSLPVAAARGGAVDLAAAGEARTRRPLPLAAVPDDLAYMIYTSGTPACRRR